MAAEDTIVFHNDDGGYEDWVRHHNGFVLTRPDKDEFMLHDCDCLHLGRGGDKDLELTKKPRRCGKRADLVDWARQETGRLPKFCRTCM